MCNFIYFFITFTFFITFFKDMVMKTKITPSFEKYAFSLFKEYNSPFKIYPNTIIIKTSRNNNKKMIITI